MTKKPEIVLPHNIYPLQLNFLNKIGNFIVNNPPLAQIQLFELHSISWGIGSIAYFYSQHPFKHGAEDLEISSNRLSAVH